MIAKEGWGGLYEKSIHIKTLWLLGWGGGGLFLFLSCGRPCDKWGKLLLLMPSVSCEVQWSSSKVFKSTLIIGCELSLNRCVSSAVQLSFELSGCLYFLQELALSFELMRSQNIFLEWKHHDPGIKPALWATAQKNKHSTYVRVHVELQCSPCFQQVLIFS